MAGVLPFALVITGYVAVHFALSILVRPARVKLVELATDLMDEQGRFKAEIQHLQGMIDFCTSSRVGVRAIFMSFAMVFDALAGARLKPDFADRPLFKDPRYRAAQDAFSLSAMAANPISVLLTIPAAILTALIWALRGQVDEDFKGTAEAPFVRASATLEPCMA